MKKWFTENIGLGNWDLACYELTDFGSPLALELYRLLKREHAFIYPEIPLCAFIERSAVEHIFTESWHSVYFLTCRADFVVCERNDGIPSLVIEYHGSYHEEEKQKEKDSFKKAVLELVGIPIVEIANSDLQELKGKAE